MLAEGDASSIGAPAYKENAEDENENEKYETGSTVHIYLVTLFFIILLSEIFLVRVVVLFSIFEFRRDVKRF